MIEKRDPCLQMVCHAGTIDLDEHVVAERVREIGRQCALKFGSLRRGESLAGGIEEVSSRGRRSHEWRCSSERSDLREVGIDLSVRATKPTRETTDRPEYLRPHT